MATMSPGPERGHEHLPGIGQEAGRVHRAVQHEGGSDPLAAQRAHEGHCLSMPIRRQRFQALIACDAPKQARHVRLGPGLVDEHEGLGINRGLQPCPVPPAAGDVRAPLFGGQDAFFWNVIPASS